MGHVVKLVFDRARKPRTEVPAGHECQIYILPCIRYERWDAPPPKEKSAPKKIRKRRARAR
jgi:hypothetical protein